MVRQPDLIVPEIADQYGVTVTTVQRSWTQHPDWPAADSRRGRWKTYPAADVAAWVSEHRARAELSGGAPGDLLTVREIHEYTGLAESTIRADISRGRFLPPDSDENGVKRWRRDTVDAAVQNRRSYRRA